MTDLKPTMITTIRPLDRMKIRVLARMDKKRRRLFVVQILNVRGDWARLSELRTIEDTAAYLRELKRHDKITDDDIEYSIT